MLYSLVLILILPVIQCFEPLTIGLIGALGAAGYNYDYLKTNIYCKFQSCCNDDYIPADIIALQQTLKTNLFGQHIVQEYLVPTLKRHYSNLEHSRKPLVMSFHGVIGTGKNFVAEQIANSIYKNGMKSDYVHFFAGRSNFPEERLAYEYSLALRDKIIQSVKSCPRSLFIFDEVDKIPPGVFAEITSLLDHHTQVDGADLRKSVFIFLTNNGGEEITQVLEEHYQNEGWRESMKLFDFEKYTKLAAYNMEGGLKKSTQIDKELIDHYVPFLPLEKGHVIKCIEAEVKKLGMPSPAGSQTEEVLRYVNFEGRFSTSGCKRIGKKVAAVL